MKLTKIILSLVTLGALAIFAISTAGAASKPADLGVSVTVAANCSISTTAVGFSTGYDPLAGTAVNNDSGSVSVTCTKNAAPWIGLSLGANAGLGTQSKMLRSGGSETLNYSLFSNSGRTVGWGNTAATGVAVSIASKNTPVVTQVYASIAADQDVPAGTYNDTVVATVNF
jgi:spore coat protein U-like protein